MVSFQGHNQIVAYSRAAYFCIFCGLIWILELILKRSDLPVSRVYGINIVISDTLHFVRDILVGECCRLTIPHIYTIPIVILSPLFVDSLWWLSFLYRIHILFPYYIPRWPSPSD